MTVANIEEYIVYLTSPAALIPFVNGDEIGNTKALKTLWMITKTIINCFKWVKKNKCEIQNKLYW